MGEDGLAEFIGPSAVQADAFHAPDPDELNAYIITAIAMIGKIDEAFGGGVQIGAAAQDGGHFGGFDGMIEAIAADKQEVAGSKLDGVGFDVDEQLTAERAAEDVAGGGAGGFLGGEDAEAGLVLGDGVVAGEEVRLTVADEVAAGIAQVGDDEAVMAKAAGDQRGGHGGAVGAGLVRGFVDVGVGFFGEAGEKGGEGLSGGCGGEARGEPIDGGAGGDLAEVGAADAIGEDEEPAVGAGAVWGGRGDVAETIFVVGALAAGVGEFGEIDEEFRAGLGVAWRHGSG
jgi:hypothetical protein